MSLTSSRAAEIFGLKGKGKIGEGYDADIVLIDPKKINYIQNSKIRSKCGWTPFDNFLFQGSIVTTIANGRMEVK